MSFDVWRSIDVVSTLQDAQLGGWECLQATKQTKNQTNGSASQHNESNVYDTFIAGPSASDDIQ